MEIRIRNLQIRYQLYNDGDAEEYSHIVLGDINSNHSKNQPYFVGSVEEFCEFMKAEIIDALKAHVNSQYSDAKMQSASINELIEKLRNLQDAVSSL